MGKVLMKLIGIEAKILVQGRKMAQPTHQQVKEAKYVSASSAAKELSRDLGEDFVSFLGENPLMPSVKVKVRYAYGEELPFRALVGRLRSYSVVSEVVYPQRLLTSLQENFQRMALVMLALSGILLLV
ncbi:MAG: hypothetical protein EBZ62_08225, partial [Sphingobacteriia bacterium]|nr:hypothetical protein [Sphingobacteriia bacterium]